MNYFKGNNIYKKNRIENMAVKKDETKKVASKKRNTKAKKTTEKTLVNNAETKEEKEVINEPLEVINGDPSVLEPLDDTKEEFKVNDATEPQMESMEEAVEDAVGESIKEAIEAPVTITEKVTKEMGKVKNKIVRNIGMMFGYSWNGQEVEY
jgi:hypothetical protein